MHPEPFTPRPLWSLATLAALGIGLVALGGAVAAFVAIARAERLADAVAAQSALAASYEARAVNCLDATVAALGHPVGAARAERSLNISEGITLCLVTAREDARLDEATLESCIRGLEAANLVSDAVLPPHRRPAC